MDQYELTEEAMQRLEECIPKRAEYALRKAYQRALTTSGKVMVAINGEILEVTAEGERRLIRKIDPPIPVKPGTKFRLNIKSSN